MQLHEVKELHEATSAEDAQDLIKAGWTLVAIVSGTRYVNGQIATGPVYVLAQPASKRPTL